MTWITTHLALEGIIGFILIGSILRAEFMRNNTNKMLFLLANFMAVIPDFDVYLGIIFKQALHRGFTHSITFPLIFICLGYLSLLYVKRKKGNFKLDLDPEDIKSNTFDISILPNFFFLCAFFWGTHILLDMDSAEGAMMLLWPLDNRLYQISLLFLFDGIPFIIFPWTPLGIELQVEQTTIKGLLSYLLNWTPADFQQYFGTTKFYLQFQGLILHIFIFITYVHFVLRPVFPRNTRVSKKLSKLRVKRISELIFSIQQFWNRIPKYLFVPGMMMMIIGFSAGPLISEKVYDDQQISGQLRFNKSIFNHLFQVGFETVDQPLDPGAIQTLNYSFHIHTNELEFKILTVIAYQNWFSNLNSKLYQIINQYTKENAPLNDSIFKMQYQEQINTILNDNDTLYLSTIVNSETEYSKLFETTEYNKFGVGFILYDWNSSQEWNQTNLNFQVDLFLETSYERNVNYFIGSSIQFIGLLFVVMSVTYFPYSTRKEN